MSRPIKQNVLSKEVFYPSVAVRGTRDCWEWTGKKTKAGYGQFWIYPKYYYAHRMSWTLENGVIPPNMLICHKCDNPGCVNPKHLFLGTYADNANDAKNKGRTRNRPHYGITHKLAKLTEDDVREIRRLYRPSPRKPSPFGGTGLAKRYGVANSLIHRIVKLQSWPHVK